MVTRARSASRNSGGERSTVLGGPANGGGDGKGRTVIWKMELGALTKGGSSGKGMTFIWPAGLHGGGKGSGGGATKTLGEFCIVTDKENGGMVGSTVGNLVEDTTLGYPKKLKDKRVKRLKENFW